MSNRKPITVREFIKEIEENYPDPDNDFVTSYKIKGRPMDAYGEYSSTRTIEGPFENNDSEPAVLKSLTPSANHTE